MLKISEHTGYVEFEIIAKPKASRNRLDGIHDGALKISVTAPPDKGKANEAITKILASNLKISKSSISITRGAASRRKTVRIEGISQAAILRLVEGSR